MANVLLQDLNRIEGTLQPISKVEVAMLHVRHGQLVGMYDDFKAIHGDLEALDTSEIGSDLRWTMSELVAMMRAEIEHEPSLRSARIVAHCTFAMAAEGTILLRDIKTSLNISGSCERDSRPQCRGRWLSGRSAGLLRQRVLPWLRTRQALRWEDVALLITVDPPSYID